MCHSFVVHSKESDELMAAALNFDALDEPEIEFEGSLSVTFEFLEYLEGPIRYSETAAHFNEPSFLK